MSKVQSVIFDSKFGSKQKMKEWLKNHGYKHYTSRKQGKWIRWRQFPPTKGASYKTIKFNSLIHGVYEINLAKLG